MATPHSQRRIQSAAVKLFAEPREELNISELAQFAGVARGTVYAYVNELDSLFEHTAKQLAQELHERIQAELQPIEDPARRVAHGIRVFIQQAHESPDWGRFMCRHGLSNHQLESLWRAQPMKDLQAGVDAGRFALDPSSLKSATAMLAGAVIAAMNLVIAGHRGWREASQETSLWVLRSLGLDENEARGIANALQTQKGIMQ